MDNAYKSAGVDVERGYEAVRRMRAHVARTRTDGVLDELGGFGGLFQPDISGMETPVMVSGTDGVGTKLKLAFAMNRHDTVGIDCVAMCVNDVVCAGAKPLFFLDYIACGRNEPARIEAIVKGVSDGCVMAGCALVGGETAEMPGFYPADEYDLAGFCVGMADKKRILNKDSVQKGDLLVALPSSGVHSNGFSLVRRVFGDSAQALSRHVDDLGCTLGEALLTPTRIYVRAILELIKSVQVKSVMHITGGGFYENIPRGIPDGLAARICRSDVRTPPLFDVIAKEGGICARDMFGTFNMGVGMCAVISAREADAAVHVLRDMGENAYLLGEITEGAGVELCGV